MAAVVSAAAAGVASTVVKLVAALILQWAQMLCRWCVRVSSVSSNAVCPFVIQVLKF